MALSQNAKAVVYAHQAGYSVTSDGRLKSPRGCARKLQISPDGYHYVSFRNRSIGGTGNMMVHRLVAYQLYGDVIFEPGMVVRHLNGDPSDNRPENISYGSQSDNRMDEPESLRRERAKHAARGLRRFTDSQVRKIRSLYSSGWTYPRLRRRFGLSKSTLSYIINGVTYKDPAWKKPERLRKRIPCTGCGSTRKKKLPSGRCAGCEHREVLWPRARQLRDEGYTYQAIADILGYRTHMTIWKWFQKHNGGGGCAHA